MIKKKSTVISVLNTKGGSGKTTIAINIAHGLQLLGHEVLLVDNDPQASTRNWQLIDDADYMTVIGLDTHNIAENLYKIKNGYDYVVIDGAPRMAKNAASVIKASDFILIPVMPSPYDVWATGDLVDLIKERQIITDGKPKACFVISRMIKNSNIGKEVYEPLNDFGFPVFEAYTSQSVTYPVTSSAGKTVFSSSQNSIKGEISNIVNELKEKLSEIA